MNMQGELFAPAAIVPGLLLVEQAISLDQEQAIAARIDEAPLKPFQFGQWEGKRLTMNYGSGYDYQRGALADAPPLPAWLAELRDQLAPLAGVDPADAQQALLIRYDPGAGIGWHRDRPQYDKVIGLSLSASAKLRLRRRIAEGFERHSIELPRRSLYLLSGEVRQDWEHSIAQMEVTRRSVTFRTLR